MGNRGPIELTDEAKEWALRRIFKDTEASVKHIEKHMPRILTEHMRRENEGFMNIMPDTEASASEL